MPFLLRKGPLHSTKASGFIVVLLAGMASCQLPLLTITHLKTESLHVTAIYLPHNSGCAGFAGLRVVPGSVGGSLGWLVYVAMAGTDGLYSCSFSPPGERAHMGAGFRKPRRRVSSMPRRLVRLCSGHPRSLPLAKASPS